MLIVKLHIRIISKKFKAIFYIFKFLNIVLSIPLLAQEVINVRPDHPRIWINAENLNKIRERNLNGAALPYWQQIKALADNPPRRDIWDAPYLAFAYLITGDTAYAKQAIEIMKKEKSLVPGDDGKSAWRPAVAFDWTYNVMSEEDRQIILANFDSSQYLDSKWLDDRMRPIDTFVNWRYHVRFAPAMLGLALAGEHPNGYKALMVGHKQFEDAYKIFENIFPDGEWTEGFHYRKHAYKFIIAYFKALKSATGIDFFKNSKAFRNNGYPVIYGTRPDNTYSRLDDIFNVNSIGTERSVFLMLNDEYRDPYYQWYLNHILDFAKYYTEPNIHPLNPLLMGAIFYDDTIPEKSLDELPLAYHCRGWGTVFMRSGWSSGSFYEPGDDVFIEFYSGDYYSYHNHLASNTFNIYYQGGLVVENGGYGVLQTVAHNTILVYDPNESFARLENDGGQLWPQAELGQPNRPHNYEEWLNNPGRWETGNIAKYENSNIYTYIYSDAASAYRPTKVKEFIRQFVYFRPNLVIVFDRVTSTNPNFQKSWVLHFIQEPVINGTEKQIEGTPNGGIWQYDGNLIQVDRGDGFKGRLFIKTLLPQNHRIEKIGGTGYEYWFNNQNHKVKRRNEYEEISNWRIEVEPTIPQKKDVFFHVISITNTSVNQLSHVSLIMTTSGDSMYGAFIEHDNIPRLTMFPVNGEKVQQFSYILSSNKTVGQLLCGLPELTPYELYKNYKLINDGTTSKAGTIYFEDIPGKNAKYSFYTSTTVPVEFGTFQAKSVDGKILLKWSIPLEQNILSFDIQRSRNGEIFQTIATVNRQTNSSGFYEFVDSNPPGDLLFYKLKIHYLNGKFRYSEIIKVQNNSIKDFILSQNYPNPFNPATRIEFRLPKTSKVNISIYNIFGELVKTLLNNEIMSPGWHSVLWNATNEEGFKVGSGIYMYKIEADNYQAYKKMLLIR